MSKGWIKIEKHWLKIVEVRNVMSNESVYWTHSHTLLFLYIYDRYTHFKKCGKNYFDNQSVISRETGMCLTTIKSRMKDMLRIGCLKVEKKKLRGFVSSNSYTVLNVFQLPMFQVVLGSGEVVPTAAEAQIKFEQKFSDSFQAPF